MSFFFSVSNFPTPGADICGNCLRKKSQEMSLIEMDKARKNIEVIQKDSSSSASLESSSTESSESSENDSFDEGVAESEFKLNKQRWKYYRRVQQANRVRARRPRFVKDKLA